MNRREFAYLTAFAGVVTSRARGNPSSSTSGKVPQAAGLITEMTFLDDCVRLAMYDSEITKTAKTALTTWTDYVHNGILSPAAVDAKSPEGYALTAGKHCSETLKRNRQPNSPEARLYQDIALMHDLASTAGRDPSKHGPVGDLLDVLHVRRRLGLHTLNPDDDIQNWLEGIVTWWRDQHDLRVALATAYTSPDNAKMREFTATFYNPADPLVRLARNFQFGEVAPADAFAPALNAAHNGSGYSRALAAAVQDLRKLAPPSNPWER